MFEHGWGQSKTHNIIIHVVIVLSIFVLKEHEECDDEMYIGGLEFKYKHWKVKIKLVKLAFF